MDDAIDITTKHTEPKAARFPDLNAWPKIHPRLKRMNSLRISMGMAALGWATGQIILSAATPLPPTAVTGKEFSSFPFELPYPPPPFPPPPPLPAQSRFWNQDGSFSWAPLLPDSLPLERLAYHYPDALANRRDRDFHEVAFANSASLLFSVENNSGLDLQRPRPEILFENPDGSAGVWAYDLTVDLNGLELWGAEGESSVDFFSLTHERRIFLPYEPGSIGTRGGAVVLERDELARAVGLVPGAGQVNGVPLDDGVIGLLTEFSLGLDALMYFRNGTDDSVLDLEWDDPVPLGAFVGDEILFSIQPISHDGQVIFDGGEIWTYTLGSDEAARFLDHGGHRWDTPFDVRGTFGVFSENVDALAALPAPAPVPEAGTLAASVFLAGLMGLGARSPRSAI